MTEWRPIPGYEGRYHAEHQARKAYALAVYVADTQWTEEVPF